MSEIAAARRFLSSKIAPVLTSAGWTWTPPGGVPTPRLFHGVAQPGAPYPLVTFQALSTGNDRRVINGNHIWSDPLYLVRVVAEGTSTAAVEPVVDAINDALHNTSGSVSGGLVVECWREREHDQPLPPVDGKMYSAIGGEYRLKVQEA